MALDIYIQPDYQDYDDGQLHLSYAEFEKLNVPDVHDFAYRGSEHRFDHDWRLYNKMYDYFADQSETSLLHIGYHAFELIWQTIINNLPTMSLLTQNEQSATRYFSNYVDDGIYPADEVQKLAAFMAHYPLTNVNRQALIRRGFLSEYQAFVDLVQQAAAQGKALEFS